MCSIWHMNIMYDAGKVIHKNWVTSEGTHHAVWNWVEPSKRFDEPWRYACHDKSWSHFFCFISTCQVVEYSVERLFQRLLKLRLLVTRITGPLQLEVSIHDNTIYEYYINRVILRVYNCWEKGMCSKGVSTPTWVTCIPSRHLCNFTDTDRRAE